MNYNDKLASALFNALRLEECFMGSNYVACFVFFFFLGCEGYLVIHFVRL